MIFLSKIINAYDVHTNIQIGMVFLVNYHMEINILYNDNKFVNVSRRSQRTPITWLKQYEYIRGRQLFLIKGHIL